MKIVVYNFDEVIQEIDLTQESISSDTEFHFYIGRSEGCHIVLDNYKVSRYHAVLVLKADQLTVINKSDYGNLKLNDQFINRSILQKNDVLKIEHYEIHILDPSKNFQDNEEIIEEKSAGKNKTEISPKTYITQKTIEETVDIDEISSPDENQKEGIDSDEINFEEKSSALFLPEQDEEKNFEEVENTEVDSAFSQSFASLDSDEGFSEEDNSDQTIVVKNFIHYYFEIHGEKAPYDRYNIKEGDNIIGREESCDIAINDIDVSSKHAVIKKSKSSFILEDLNSTNGTLLNGERINLAELNEGDEFVIGSTSFVVKINAQEEEADYPDLLVDEEEELEVAGESYDEKIHENLSAKSGSIFQDPEKRKKILFVLIGVLVIWIFLGEEDSEKVVKKNVPIKKSSSVKEKEKKEEKKTPPKEEVKLTPEQTDFLEARYLLSKEFIAQNKYQEAISELESIFNIVNEYKESKQLYELAKEGQRKLEELNKIEQEKIAREKIRKKITILLEKSRDAVKERQVTLAESYFSQILEMDPENIEVSQLRLELEAWQKKKEEEALRKAKIEATRKKELALLRPGKTNYLKKEWYAATVRLEKFLKLDNIVNEDLIKEASEMFKQAQENLDNTITPLLRKADDYFSNRELKKSYQVYNKVLEHHPDNKKSIKRIDEINSIIEKRARDIYRKALVYESLSLFTEAKEELQKVLEISITGSEYYEKAKKRMEHYPE